MSRWSDKGQAEPIAALVALLAVGAGLGIYAGVLANAPPEPTPDVAERTLDRVHDASTSNGVVDPADLTIPAAATSGTDRGGSTDDPVLAELTSGEYRWITGTATSDDRTAAEIAAEDPAAHSVKRRVSVRIAPGDTRPGTLRVVVWQ